MTGITVADNLKHLNHIIYYFLTSLFTNAANTGRGAWRSRRTASISSRRAIATDSAPSRSRTDRRGDISDVIGGVTMHHVWTSLIIDRITRMRNRPDDVRCAGVSAAAADIRLQLPHVELVFGRHRTG